MPKEVRVIVDNKELKEIRGGNPGPGEFVVRNNRIVYGDPGKPDRPLRPTREREPQE